MIWYWLSKLGELVVWLFKPVTAGQIAKASFKEKCPVCGHAGVDLRAVHILVNPRANQDGLAVRLQSRCEACGGRWYTEPVRKVGVQDVLPGIPRTEMEKDEDETNARTIMPVGRAQ